MSDLTVDCPHCGTLHPTSELIKCVQDSAHQLYEFCMLGTEVEKRCRGCNRKFKIRCIRPPIFSSHDAFEFEEETHS